MFNTLSTCLRSCWSYGVARQNNKGFTIIELLVVIAIIGLISSVVLVSMRGSTGKAKIAKGLEFSQTIMNTIGHDAVAVWNFDEGSGGTVHDKSGYKNHGTRTGNTQWVSGEENTPHWFVDRGKGKFALRMVDGNSDYVNIPDSSSLDIIKSITVEAWVKGDRWSTNDIMLHKGGAYGLWYDWTGTSADNNEFQFMFYSGSWRVCDSDFNPKINTWYHIVGSYDYDNNKCHFYVNGNLEKTRTYTQQIRTSVNPLRIGYSGDHRFKGIIDEVRIYARALSSSEIQQHYVAGAQKH